MWHVKLYDSIVKDVIHLTFMLLYDIFQSWLCDLFKLICNDIITGKS